MAQFPVIPDEWFPIAGSSQFLSPASSTALTVPAIAAGQPAKGAVILAELVCSGDSVWLRMDGGTAAASQGVLMNVGDWRIVYGTQALAALRAIRASASSLLTVSYFYFRMTPG